MSTSRHTATAPRARAISAIQRSWPAAVGLLGAAFVSIVSPDRETVVVTVLVAVGCYLAAAALGVRWVAWAAIPIGSALAVGGGLMGIDPWFVLGGASIVLAIIGLLRPALRTAVAAQSVAVVAYGGFALTALALGPTTGAVLASLALMAHAIWDVIHFRRDAVVPRSLAKACLFLDIPLGVAVLVLALLGRL